MPNIIYKIDNYRNEDVVNKLVQYIISSDYIESVGQNGCFYKPGQSYVDSVPESFNAVKNVCYKNNGQLVQHIIIGFGEAENIGESEAAAMAMIIAGYFYGIGYQTFWGVHWGSKRSDKYRHIHIVVNTVSVVTGLRYTASYENMNELKNYLVRLYPKASWNYYESKSFYQEYT